MSPSSETFVSDLKRQLAEKRVVAIVGAGVSVATASGNPVASWHGLLLDGVARCEAVVPGLSRGWGTRVTAEIQSGDIDDLLSAAEKISSKLGSQGGEYSRWLRETVGSLIPSDVHVVRALASLEIPIITTNYDSLIEDITGWPAVTWRQAAEVEYLIRGDERGVLHLHGHWRDPQSIILSIRSYSQILGDEHTQAILQALRATRTFLFIGYGAGLTDPNFVAFLRWARTAFATSEFRHYRLVRQKDLAEVQAAHEPADRIFALPYGTNYADLPSFLFSLKASTGGHAETISTEARPVPDKRAIKIFISYSRKDERYRDLLERHLAPLRHSGEVELWSDRRITPGEDWGSKIDSGLEESDLVLLLLSPDFLASDYCYSIEMQRALERHSGGSARLIPIIVRPVDWVSTPLAKLQALPRDGKPISTWPSRDEALVDVARGIRRVVEEMSRNPESEGTFGAVASPSTGIVAKAASHGEGILTRRAEQVRPLGRVFVKQGEPTMTFVEPPQFRDLKLALLQHGRGVIVEGPSGIGKTSAVTRAIADLRHSGKLPSNDGWQLLSARQDSDVRRLATLEHWHSGAVVIDDFHRLPRPLYDTVANRLKYLADTGDSIRKLVLIGIPKTNQALIDLSFDLATRIEVLQFNRVDDDLVLKMIELGEHALNVRFERKSEIVLAAGGSLNIGQYLCYHVCKEADVLETQPQPTEVVCQVEKAIDSVLIELGRKFREGVRRFIGLGGPRDRTCLRLLEELTRNDEGAVSFVELKDSAPLIAGGLRRFKKERWLPRLYAEVPDSERLLFYDATSERLTIDDPQLGFYLRKTSLEQLARAAGVVQLRPGRRVVILYVRGDRRWFDRLRIHFGPLEQQGLVQIDAWEQARLGSGTGAAAELRLATEAAAAVLCIVSADYLDSEFFDNDVGDVLNVLTAARERGSEVLSIIARPCRYDGTGLESFPIINAGAPLSKADEAGVDESLADVVTMVANRVA